jgi:hypothetical protein
MEPAAPYKITASRQGTAMDVSGVGSAIVYLDSVVASPDWSSAADVVERVLATVPTSGVAVSVVIPVYNEETIIRDVVTVLSRELTVFPFKTEVLIVENGSTDITRQILEIIIGQYANARLVSTEEPSYGKALKRGIELAAGDLVVVFNADLWSMRFFVDALLLLQGGYDAVVGSKRLVASLDHRPWIRRLITLAFNSFLRIVFGFAGTDTHGMKALRRSSILRALKSCVTDREVFDTELMLRLQKSRARICEIPTEVQDSRPARLSLLRRVPATLVDLCRIWRDLGSARRAVC